MLPLSFVLVEVNKRLEKCQVPGLLASQELYDLLLSVAAESYCVIKRRNLIALVVVLCYVVLVFWIKLDVSCQLHQAFFVCIVFHILCSFLFGVFSLFILFLVRNKRALLSVLVIRSSRTKRDQHHLHLFTILYYSFLGPKAWPVFQKKFVIIVTWYLFPIHLPIIPLFRGFVQQVSRDMLYQERGHLVAPQRRGDERSPVGVPQPLHELGPVPDSLDFPKAQHDDFYGGLGRSLSLHAPQLDLAGYRGKLQQLFQLSQVGTGSGQPFREIARGFLRVVHCVFLSLGVTSQLYRAAALACILTLKFSRKHCLFCFSRMPYVGSVSSI